MGACEMRGAERNRSRRGSHLSGVAGRVVLAVLLLVLLATGVACQGRFGWLQPVEQGPSSTEVSADERRLSELSQSAADDFWWASPEEDSQAAVDSRPAGSYTDGLTVNPLYRSASAAFYQEHYLVPEDLDAAWTGAHADCDPGDISQAFRATLQQRVNYFRAMAGVPALITLEDEFNRKAQSAALMMSVNGRLDHWPDSSWYCYSEEGTE